LGNDAKVWLRAWRLPDKPAYAVARIFGQIGDGSVIGLCFAVSMIIDFYKARPCALTQRSGVPIPVFAGTPFDEAFIAGIRGSARAGYDNTDNGLRSQQRRDIL
jgi:hypothetical protein